MECVYFGSANATAKGWCGGVGAGPWVMADLESGLWACGDRPGVNNNTVSMTTPFVTGMVKGFGDVPPNGRWQILGGDAAAGPLAGILGYEPRPLVSADYARDTRSSIVDGLSTLVTDGTLLKVYAWYDNEMGYACRMVDLACHMREAGI